MRALWKLAGCLTIVFGLSSPVVARPPEIWVKQQNPSAEGVQLVETGPALAPMGHVIYCLKTPSECESKRSSSSTIAFEAKISKLLARVNSRVNNSIIPVRDTGEWPGKDNWTNNPKRGDCEDFALTKQHELLKMGLPSSALRLAFARTERGEGHVVLVVRTTNGDYVLDNLKSEVLSLFESNLIWESMQSGENPKLWQKVQMSNFEKFV
jgi:predicted transglutaminase-like cysteine proteinase